MSKRLGVSHMIVARALSKGKTGSWTLPKRGPNVAKGPGSSLSGSGCNGGVRDKRIGLETITPVVPALTSLCRPFLSGTL